MKRYPLFYLLLVVLISEACNTNNQPGLISGKLEGAEGATIYLESYVNNKSVYTDSTIAGADGSFALMPHQALQPDFYQLVINEKQFITLITDSSENIKLSGNLKNLDESLKISGSTNSEALRSFDLECLPMINTEKSLSEQLRSNQLSEIEFQQTKDKLVEARKKRTEHVKKWLERNSSTPSALIAVQHLDPRAENQNYQAVFSNLKGTYGHSAIYKGLKQQVQMLITKQNQPPAPAEKNQLGEGAYAPEIAMADPTGKIRKLSSLRGKTVLIDFWASWCGPCRRENPNVVAAYKKYNKSGFEVFSVSLDKTKEQWTQAIAEDGLVWKNHVSDLKWWDNQAAKTYGVSSIPFTMLIDEQGKVLGYNLRGAALEEKLASIYGR